MSQVTTSVQKVGLSIHAASEVKPSHSTTIAHDDISRPILRSGHDGSLAVVANKRPRRNLGVRALRAPTSNHSQEGGVRDDRMNRATESGRARNRDDWESVGMVSFLLILRNEECR
jgi:hypothetical protein